MRIPEFMSNISHHDFLLIINNLPRPKFVRVDGDGNIDVSGLPRFNESFDTLCRTLNRIPTQDEYSDYYKSLCDEFCTTYKVDKKKLRARAARNYPSFIREYQLYFLLKEHFQKSQIIFSLEWDKKGVDFVLVGENNMKFGIMSMVDTYLSKKYDHIKDAYRREKVDFPVLKLKLDKNNCFELNGYWLYSMEHVLEIKNFIKTKVIPAYKKAQ